METTATPLPDIDRKRLFIGSCMALIATAVAFATIGAIMLALKREFILTNAEVGYIGGAALWGFAVSQVIFAPLCDTLGMRYLLRLAFVGHAAGVIIMIMSTGFWGLFIGALIIALGNGLVEAACNPLVATLFPDDKTVKLNQFHVWFPGGIVIGGVAAYLLDLVGIGTWEIKLALILIPTAVYAYLMLGQKFPPTENVQAGVSMKQMFKATFTTPFMLLLLFCMAITASTELGPNRWVPAVLEAGGMPGILVLVWISGLMAVLRYKAGVVVHRISPTGILFVSAIVSAVGLLWLSYAESLGVAFVAATIFAVGICYFWPTMLGVVSERVPRSGALGLGLMGAIGMGIVGIFTAPQMGAVADQYAHEYLVEENLGSTLAVFETVAEAYPPLAEQAEGAFQDQITSASQTAQDVLQTYETSNTLPEPAAANALRVIIDSEAAVLETDPESTVIIDQARAVLNPADNYGGRISFRFVVPFTCLLIVIFGVLYWRDRKAGGYKITKITDDPDGEVRRATIAAS